MSFHKRYISNEHIFSLYSNGGVSQIIKWYTRGVDAIITEAGIASDISKILNNSDWATLDPVKLDNTILNLIHSNFKIKL